jgi:hypothetical protein
MTNFSYDNSSSDGEDVFNSKNNLQIADRGMN